MTREVVNLRNWLAFVVLACTLVVAGFLVRSKISIDYASFKTVAATVVTLALAGRICARRGSLRLSLMMEALAFTIALSLLVAVGSYLAISQDYPLADDFLRKADEVLGFDGRGLIRYIDGFPLLAWTLMLAYTSFAFQVLLLPVLLIVSGRPQHGLGLVFGFGLVCIGASTVSVWFPAAAAYVTYGIEPSSLNAINAHFGYQFLEEFHAVRERAAFVLSMGKLQGLLTFPSVHTATAVLCIAFTFGTGWLRYPFLLLNALMAFSTLTHGGHYLVDVLAGGLLALAAVAVVWGVSGLPVRRAGGPARVLAESRSG
ncbi:phosphatase PAP2 family protein [Ciceribacter ferrooxidans]|uniref:Inositolphosphotransferase Aur1/Ipt1 domain-containing protein n=1 Tax=Ciceribacter ferrooxidans TaxID=2509717 RepID=A0A4V1RQ84_9HYPH|nr:phosphatase PAP2 family protein [Ciceribacter ferrooxidans]RYC11967.1 hypothetical protein EUU22_12940 [Ciceribacter ferrooxidans]